MRPHGRWRCGAQKFRLVGGPMMTTDPIQARHEAGLQERERGQRENEDGLRRSNKALTDEVHRLRALVDVGARIEVDHSCERTSKIYENRIGELEQQLTAWQ